MTLRSQFGGHFAGMGIVQEPDMQDDFIIRRGIKVYREIQFSTDHFGHSKEENEAFQEYCKSMSGEVTTYNIYDKEERKAS
ncbi:hypothetical protein ABWK22_01895 [Gottfriedia acidiceleris]|uniref:hypothetical protein n=1 Tax=Gottfriedia acidiceleris TaxID=371036 RepID=UPI003397ABA2